VVICCGKGNNGGDGLVIARHLDLFGLPVRALLFADPESLSGDARVQFQVLTRLGFPIEVHPGPLDRASLDETLAGAAWVVDALYGTGLKGPVRAPHDTVIEAINAASARVLAVDIPSGLDGDTGQPLGPTVRAEHTATFLACKRGLALPEARAWTGTIHVLPIGLPPRLLGSGQQG
jgi:NAD(P)H-hydrate epimerase